MRGATVAFHATPRVQESLAVSKPGGFRAGGAMINTENVGALPTPLLMSPERADIRSIGYSGAAVGECSKEAIRHPHRHYCCADSRS